MKTKIIICLTFGLFFTTILTQQIEKKIIGKWECYKVEREDGVTKGVDMFGKKFEISCNGLIIDLKADLTGWESLGHQKFDYKLKDSVLRLGNRYYIVELLNKKELRIRDYDPNKLSFDNSKQSFKKIK